MRDGTANVPESDRTPLFTGPCAALQVLRLALDDEAARACGSNLVLTAATLELSCLLATLGRVPPLRLLPISYQDYHMLC